MKLLDIILENDEERLIKRAKTIYNTFKRGIIKAGKMNVLVKKRHNYYEDKKNEFDVEYVLPDQYVINFNFKRDVPNLRVGCYDCDDRVKFYYVDKQTGEKTECKVSYDGYQAIIDVIDKKFKRFGIVLYCLVKGDDEDMINEDDNHTSKEIKRVRAVLNVINKGLFFKSDKGKLYYELPKKYEIKEKGPTNISEDRYSIVVVGNNGEDNCIKYFYQSSCNFKRLNLF
jgi:hypothetical protein